MGNTEHDIRTAHADAAAELAALRARVEKAERERSASRERVRDLELLLAALATSFSAASKILAKYPNARDLASSFRDLAEDVRAAVAVAGEPDA